MVESMEDILNSCLSAVQRNKALLSRIQLVYSVILETLEPQPPTPTSFFVAIIASLSKQLEVQNEVRREEQLPTDSGLLCSALLCLLSSTIPHLPHRVLSQQSVFIFSSAVAPLVTILEQEADVRRQSIELKYNTLVLSETLKCCSLLLPHIPQSSYPPGAQRILKAVFVFSADPRKLVRHAASQAAIDILRIHKLRENKKANARSFSATVHKTFKEFCLREIENSWRTDPLSIKYLCYSLLVHSLPLVPYHVAISILQSLFSHTERDRNSGAGMRLGVVSLNTLASFFQELCDDESENQRHDNRLVISLLSSLISWSPPHTSTQLWQAHMSAVVSGLSLFSASTSIAIEYIISLKKLLATTSFPFLAPSAALTIGTVVLICIAKEQQEEREESLTSLCIDELCGLLSFQFRSVWIPILQFAITPFLSHGPNAFASPQDAVAVLGPLLETLVSIRNEVVSKSTDNHDFQLLRAFDDTLSAAISSLGPSSFLSLFPVNLLHDESNILSSIMWLFPLILKNLDSNVSLEFFFHDLMPNALQSLHLSQQLSHSNIVASDMSQERIKLFDTFSRHIWSLFPSFCLLSPLSEAALSVIPLLLEQLKELLLSDLSQHLYFAVSACKGIAILIDSLQTQYQERDKQNEVAAYSSVLATVETLAPEFLQILLKLLQQCANPNPNTSSESLRIAVVATIRSFATLTARSTLKPLFEGVFRSLLTFHQEHQISLSFLVDSLLSLLNGLSEDNLNTIYHLGKQKLHSNDDNERRKGYELLYGILETDADLHDSKLIALSFGMDLGDILTVPTTLISSHATLRARLQLISLLIKHFHRFSSLSYDKKVTTLSFWLNESLHAISIKDSSSKTKAIGFQVLHALCARHIDDEKEEKKREAKDIFISFLQQLLERIANHASEPLVQASILSAISRLIYEAFHPSSCHHIVLVSESDDGVVLAELIRIASQQSTSPSNEIVRAAFSLLKVGIIVSSGELLLRSLNQICEFISSAWLKGNVRRKLKSLLQLLLEKVGEDQVLDAFHQRDNMHQWLKNVIREARRRHKKRKRSATEGDSVVTDPKYDSHNQEQELNNFFSKMDRDDGIIDFDEGAEADDDVQDEDLDEDEDAIIFCLTPFGRALKQQEIILKKTQNQTSSAQAHHHHQQDHNSQTKEQRVVIREHPQNPLDLLSSESWENITRTTVSGYKQRQRGERQMQDKQDDEFRIDRNGRIVIQESYNRKDAVEESTNAWSLEEDDEENKTSKKRHREDFDEEKRQQSQHTNKKSRVSHPRSRKHLSGFEDGSRYLAKKGKGDRTIPGQPDPYAYIPLSTNISSSLLNIGARSKFARAKGYKRQRKQQQTQTGRDGKSGRRRRN